MRCSKPLILLSTRRRTRSPVSFADESSGTKSSGGQMYCMDNMSMPTEYLPSTTLFDSYVQQQVQVDSDQQFCEVLALYERLRTFQRTHCYIGAAVRRNPPKNTPHVADASATIKLPDGSKVPVNLFQVLWHSPLCKFISN